MSLKLVVTSMSILGLISCSVFADTYSKRNPSNYFQSTYSTCTIPQSFLNMQAITQNMGRALPDQCNPGWFNRIALSGGVNIDVGKWGNRNNYYMGENYKYLSLNDAYLNLAAIVNDYALAFVSLSYNTATINDPNASTITNHVAEFDAAYSDNIKNGATHRFQLEQAFITLSNFSVSPIFIQVGKQFQDFSRYQIHPITESMTEVMSKTLATSVKIGFLYKRFNGSFYALDDHLAKVNHTSKSTNYGLSVGYDQLPTCNQIGLDAGIGYLYNLIGVNDIAYQVNQFNLNNPLNLPGGGYNKHVGGVALYADVITTPITISARYTVAVQRFNVSDLPRDGIAALGPTGIPIAGAHGAEPWAAAFQVGYGFERWGKPQNIYLGYQTSQQAAGLLLPKTRWLGGYGIEMGRNTHLGVEWDYDMDYSTANGGTGRNTNLLSLRAQVKFS